LDLSQLQLIQATWTRLARHKHSVLTLEVLLTRITLEGFMFLKVPLIMIMIGFMMIKTSLFFAKQSNAIQIAGGAGS